MVPKIIPPLSPPARTEEGSFSVMVILSAEAEVENYQNPRGKYYQLIDFGAFRGRKRKVNRQDYPRSRKL
jgi:hypothetical protein